MHYRDYKTFDNNVFKEHLLQSLDQVNVSIIRNNHLCQFLEIFVDALDKYARGNLFPFTCKQLSEAIMNRTRPCNRFLQNISQENKMRYSKQSNNCVSLLRKTKQNFYSHINENNETDDKKAWKTLTSLLLNKVLSDAQISLMDGDELIDTDIQNAVK